MDKVKMISVFFICFFINNTLAGQGVKSELRLNYQTKDSVSVVLTIENTTNNIIFIKNIIDRLLFYDYASINANYGSPENNFYAQKANVTINKEGYAGDIIEFVLPETSARFQKDTKGNEIDIFKVFTELHQIYHNQKLPQIYQAPLPPKAGEGFIDKKLYDIITNEGLHKDCAIILSSAILLAPNEKKEISIDLGYLLLRRATYKIKYDYSLSYNYTKSEQELIGQRNYEKIMNFFQKNKIKMYKGRIKSNTIKIVSE